MLAPDLELTTARLRVYFSRVDNCLPKLFMASLMCGRRTTRGNHRSAKTEQGRIVELASRRALPSPSPSANLVGIREGQLRTTRLLTARRILRCAVTSRA
jgi:hypothetical protein